MSSHPTAEAHTRPWDGMHRMNRITIDPAGDSIAARSILYALVCSWTAVPDGGRYRHDAIATVTQIIAADPAASALDLQIPFADWRSIDEEIGARFPDARDREAYDLHLADKYESLLGATRLSSLELVSATLWYGVKHGNTLLDEPTAALAPN